MENKWLNWKLPPAVELKCPRPRTDKTDKSRFWQFCQFPFWEVSYCAGPLVLNFGRTCRVIDSERT